MSEFSLKARQWILSLISQRKLLIKTGHSKINEQEASVAIRDLELYLGAYSYANPLQMARFINGHKAQIASILPGMGSASHEKKQKEFEALCRLSSVIMNGKQTEMRYADSN